MVINLSRPPSAAEGGRRLPRKKRNLFLLAALVLAGVPLAYSRLLPVGYEDMLIPIPVEQGVFVISLKLKGGELEAVKSQQINAPWVLSRPRIVDLWPEGEKVDTGNLMVKFDPIQIQKQIVEAEQALEAAKAVLLVTKVNQQVEVSRQEAGIENQKAHLRLSQLQVAKMQFEATIKKEEETLKAKQTELALAQAQRRLAAQKAVNAVELKKVELEVIQRERDLDRVRKDLDKLEIKAENPGVVIYQKIASESGGDKVKIGDEPYGGQPLITLPDLTRMQVEIQADEVDVDKLRVGQAAVVELEALPEATFHGQVTSIANLGHSKAGVKKVKVFDLIVAIEEEDARFMPGMTAHCTVIIETVPALSGPTAPDAVPAGAGAKALSADLPLYVPLDAIFEKQGKPVVYRLKYGRPEEQAVKLGKKNDNYAIIEEGLSPGDRVTLRDPTLIFQTQVSTSGSAQPSPE